LEPYSAYHNTPCSSKWPRRGHFDEHGVLWYAEYGSNAVGRFDPKTQKITEWQMPVKWQMPYDALSNKKGDVYTGMASGRARS
jgi:streptogramin lyase